MACTTITLSWTAVILLSSTLAWPGSAAKARQHFAKGDLHFQNAFARGTPESADRREAWRALAAYEAGLALDPGLATAPAAYRVHQRTGLCYEALALHDKAMAAYMKATLFSPGNPVLPLYAARLLQRLGHEPAAAAELAAALRTARLSGRDQDLAAMIRAHPHFSILLQGELSGAILREYETLVSGRSEGSKRAPGMEPPDAAPGPEDPERLSRAYERIGTAYNKLGLADQAIKALKRALEYSSRNAGARYQLALAYAASRRYSLALAALGKALTGARSLAEFRRLTLLSRTDPELEPIRERAAFSIPSVWRPSNRRDAGAL